MTRLSGKVAVVTGGTQGIGKGIVLRLASEGAHVVFCSRNAAKSGPVLDELQRRGGVGFYVQADLTVRAQAEKVIEEAVRRFGRIDILVNNAQSRTPPGPLEERPDGLFRDMFECGLMASFWTMKTAFPFMKEQRSGRIVNFSSYSATIGMIGKSDYNAAKAAVAALTRSAAQEWGQFEITVNAVSPAGANEAIQSFLDSNPQAAADLVSEIPLRRIGDCELDIASAVLGLVSDDARFITGHVLGLDGGSHLRPPMAAATRLPVKLD